MNNNYIGEIMIKSNNEIKNKKSDERSEMLEAIKLAYEFSDTQWELVREMMEKYVENMDKNEFLKVLRNANLPQEGYVLEGQMKIDEISNTSELER